MILSHLGTVRLAPQWPGYWACAVAGRCFDAELEPRWQRWRVAERTEHGAIDIGTASTLEGAEQLVLDELLRGDAP